PEMGLVARPDEVRDDADLAIVALHLAEQDVARLERLGDRLQVARHERKAHVDGVADPPQLRHPLRRGKPSDGGVREVLGHAIEIRRAGLVVEWHDDDAWRILASARAEDGPTDDARNYQNARNRQ